MAIKPSDQGSGAVETPPLAKLTVVPFVTKSLLLAL